MPEQTYPEPTVGALIFNEEGRVGQRGTGLLLGDTGRSIETAG